MVPAFEKMDAVSRKNPLPKREIEICRRLREARLFMNLSQVKCARMLDIDSSRLGSYEHARVPLRLELAYSLAAQTGLSLQWLASGVKPMFGPLPKHNWPIDAQNHILLSEAWDKFTQATSSTKQSDRAAFYATIDPYLTSASLLDYLEEEFAGIFKLLPPELHENFYSHVTKAAQEFVAANMAAATVLKFKALENPQKNLTESSSGGNLSEVKSQLPILLERLNRATQASGQMSSLAKFLGVPLASVSRWLAGKREPSGEITLKLLKWVEQQERQK